MKRLEQQIQPRSTDVTAIPNNLPPLESDVFRYVSDHSHCSKADVERHLKGKSARVTTFKTIDTLVECGFIRDELNEKNRQTHSLVVNNDNELSLLIQKLDKFEKAYFSLIDKLKERFEILKVKANHSKNMGLWKIYCQSISLFWSIFHARDLHMCPEESVMMNPFGGPICYIIYRGCLICN